MEQKKRGQLIIISGPSGSGKGTVISKLMEKRGNIHFSVSYATRAPRIGEIDGVHYNFITREEFEARIADDDFWEYAQYSTNYYGTERKVNEAKLAQGVDVLLDIEVQGAKIIHEKFPDAVLVFMMPPTYEELERRLRGRKTDDEETIQKRLKRALEEVKEIPMYDYLVINDEVDHAADQLDAIMSVAELRPGRRQKDIDAFV